MIKKLNDSFHTFGLWLTSGFDDNNRRNQNGRRRDLLSSVSTSMLNHCMNNNNHSSSNFNNDTHTSRYHGHLNNINGNNANNGGRNQQRVVSSDDIYRISLNNPPLSSSTSINCEKTHQKSNKKLSKFKRGLSFLKEKSSSHNNQTQNSAKYNQNSHSLTSSNINTQSLTYNSDIDNVNHINSHMKKSINLEHLDEYVNDNNHHKQTAAPIGRDHVTLDECYSIDSGVGTTSDLCSNFYKINVSREQFASTLDEINRNAYNNNNSNHDNSRCHVANDQSTRTAPIVGEEEDVNENRSLENDAETHTCSSSSGFLLSREQINNRHGGMSVHDESKMSRSSDDVDMSIQYEKNGSSRPHGRLSIFRDATDDNIRIFDKNAAHHHNQNAVSSCQTINKPAAADGHVSRSQSRDQQNQPKKCGLNFRLSSKISSKLKPQHSPKDKNRNSAIVDSKSLWNLRGEIGGGSKKQQQQPPVHVDHVFSKSAHFGATSAVDQTVTNGSFAGNSHFKRPARPKSEHFASCQMISVKAGRGISTDSPTGLFGRKETYETLEKLGEGSYASVYKGQNVFDGTIVALKEIRINAEEGCPFTAIREASLLKGLKHANIVLLHDIIHTKDCLTFVFEYVHNDLSQYLERNPMGIHPSNVKLFLYQLLRGLAYCHDKKILHRDIKPQNLLISESGELKLADFGLARAKSVPSHTYSHEVVTLWYRPPDVLLGSTTYSTSLDMWGVGCIFAEMITGNALFPGAKDVFDQLDRIFRLMGTPTEETWEGVTKLPNYVPRLFTFYPYKRPLKISDKIDSIPNGEPLLSSFLQMNPDKRISARAAMAHPYFSDLPPQVHILPHISSIFIVPGIRLVPEYRMRSCYNNQRSHWQDVDC